MAQKKSKMLLKMQRVRSTTIIAQHSAEGTRNTVNILF